MGAVRVAWSLLPRQGRPAVWEAIGRVLLLVVKNLGLQNENLIRLLGKPHLDVRRYCYDAHGILEFHRCKYTSEISKTFIRT